MTEEQETVVEALIFHFENTCFDAYWHLIAELSSELGISRTQMNVYVKSHSRFQSSFIDYGKMTEGGIP